MMRTTGTNTEKKTLLFGGSFDPVHKGHLYIIEKACELTDYERIIIMPAYKSNFKRGTKPASAAERYEMLSIALADLVLPHDAEIVLSSYEIEKKGISYTYDTVRHIYDEYALNGKLGFLMGDDLLHDLDRWYNYDALKELVTFVCFTRCRDSLTYPGDADIIFYDVPPYKASSTDVREGDFSELTTDVRRYIEEHGLYNS